MAELRTIHLHGALGKKYGRTRRLAVRSAAEAFHALSVLHPGFLSELDAGGYRVVRGKSRTGGMRLAPEHAHLGLGKETDLHIIPTPKLSGFDPFSWAILAVVAIVGVVAIASIPTITPPDPNDREEERKSFIFDGADNRTEQGHPVPWVYGRMRVGSIVGSGGITTTDIPYEGLDEDLTTPGTGSGNPKKDLIKTILPIFAGAAVSKGGKGGGSQRAAREDPNSLQSQATARVLDIIAEGEIGGLVNGLKSIYFDNTPVQNSDDTFNFKGVSFQMRNGLPDQTYIPGTSQQEGTEEVGLEVSVVGGPVVQTITDADVNAVRVTLGLNALQYQDTSTGDLLRTSVEAKIELQSDGGGYTEVTRHVFNGKTTSPYEWSIDIPLPAGGHPWDIRVSRVTEDRPAANYADDIFWRSYTEIVDAKLTYPNTAIVHIVADAKQFGSNIPDRAYEIYGKIVQVPTNYDPVTRAYATTGPGTSGGTWDGTFKWAWSDNPAWGFYDLCTNSRYGLGRRIGPNRINKFTLYVIAQYCDQLVPDGFGGMEPRFTLNCCINTQKKAHDVLQALASNFNGMVYWSQGAVHLTQECPKDVDFIFTQANTVDGDGQPTYESGDLDEKYAGFLVSWNDPEDAYKLATEVTEDRDVRAKVGWKTKSVAGFGITSRGQAARVGRRLKDKQTYGSDKVRYKAGPDHIAVTPGNVVAGAEKGFAGRRIGGRLRVGCTTTLLKLDKPVDLAPGEAYTARVVLPDGSVAESHVLNAAGLNAELNLETALPAAPQRASIWSVYSDQVVQRQWRVLSVGEDQDHLGRPIVAESYDPLSFDRIELGLKLEPRSYTSQGGIVPTGPQAISYTEFFKIVGSAATASALFSWTLPNDPRVIAFQKQVQRPDALDFESLPPDNLTPSVEVTNIVAGVYRFRVRSINSLGHKSPWSECEVTLAGLPAPPQVPSAFEAYPGEDLIRFVWNTVPSSYSVDYEVRQGPTWDEGVPILRVSTATATIKRPQNAPDDAMFWLKSRIVGANDAGIYSTEARLCFTYQEPIPRNVVLDLDASSLDWPGVKHDLTLNGTGASSILTLDAPGGVRRPYGDYFGKVDLGQVYYARNWIDTTSGAVTGSDLEWDDLDVAWDDLGDLTWDPVVTSVDGVSLAALIAVDTPPNDLLAGFRLEDAGSLVGTDSTAVAASSGTGTYAPGRCVNGTDLDADTDYIAWDRSSGVETFTLVASVRPSAAPAGASRHILQIGETDADPRYDLSIIPDTTDKLRLTKTVASSTTTVVEMDIVDLATDDVYTFALVQGEDDVTVFWNSRRDVTVRSMTAVQAPLGSNLRRIRIGDGTRILKGVWSDVDLYSSVWDEDDFLELAFLRGPSGYGKFRPLVPGDYSYEQAVVWNRLSAPSGVGDQLAIGESTVHVDLPDVVDTGTVNVTTSPTAVVFNRSFNAAPTVTLQQTGGTGVAHAKITTGPTASGFTVTSYAVDGTTPLAATFQWQAVGY